MPFCCLIRAFKASKEAFLNEDSLKKGNIAGVDNILLI